MKRNHNTTVTKSRRRPQLPVYRPGRPKHRQPKGVPVLLAPEQRHIEVRKTKISIPSGIREIKAQDGEQLLRKYADDANLRVMLGLRDALDNRDIAAAAKLIREVVGELRNASDDLMRLFGDLYSLAARELLPADLVRAFLSQIVTTKLDAARLGLWLDRATGQFVPAIYCPDERTALFVWALFGIIGEGKRLGFCPRCGKLFMGRSDQTYCTSRCAAAYRMAKMREQRSHGGRGAAK